MKTITMGSYIRVYNWIGEFLPEYLVYNEINHDDYVSETDFIDACIELIETKEPGLNEDWVISLAKEHVDEYRKQQQ